MTDLTPHRPVVDHRRGLLLAGSGMILISPDSLILRLMQTAGIWEIAFYRSLFLGIGMTALAAVSTGCGLAGLVRNLGRLGLVSAVLIALTNIGFVVAIDNTAVANLLVILATIPLFAGVFGWFLLGEAVRPRTMAAIAAGLVGVVIIVFGSFGGGRLFGDAMALVTAAGLGLNLVVLRKARPTALIPALALGGFLGACLSVPMVDFSAPSGRDMVFLAAAGLLQLPAALALFFAGTKYLPAAEVGLLTLIETVLGPLWVWIGVGERPPLGTFVGGAVIVGALAFNAVLALMRPAGGVRGRLFDRSTGE